MSSTSEFNSPLDLINRLWFVIGFVLSLQGCCYEWLQKIVLPPLKVVAMNDYTYLFCPFNVVTMNDSKYTKSWKRAPESSSPPPPVWDFQPPASMYSKFDPRKLVFHLPPNHIDSIFFSRGVLELVMARDVFQLLPHFNPSLFWKSPELIHHITRFQCLFVREENWELGVVNFIFKWELNLITYNDRNTVAHNGIKQATRWRCVSCRMQTELWQTHTLRGLV